MTHNMDDIITHMICMLTIDLQSFPHHLYHYHITPLSISYVIATNSKPIKINQTIIARMLFLIQIAAIAAV
jgi:hypothetical protein